MPHPKHATNKVGIAPYIMQDGEAQFLIHLPKAKNPAEQSDMVWGLVRGTIEPDDSNNRATALREAKEEAGIALSDIKMDTLKNHGSFSYRSQRKAPYDLPFFSAELNHDCLASLKAAAQDCQDLAFKTLSEIEEMERAEQFKPGYVTILRDIAQQIAEPAIAPGR